MAPTARGGELLELDLREAPACREAVQGVGQVFNLAADMGGIGFIEENKALCMLSVLINANLLQASVHAVVERFFFSSSACSSQADPQQRSLPYRYQEEWGAEFWAAMHEALRPGIAVLDVGAGRRPTIAIEGRPDGVRYVGLDVDGDELAAAPPGSYDEAVAADVGGSAVPGFENSFDLIVSWQSLEHVRNLPRAAGLLHGYCKPGGVFVACLSGRWAAFAVANRVLPAGVGSRLVARVRKRALETVFPAHYDHCDDRGLREAFSGWDQVDVIPKWRGADYFIPLPRLLPLYLRYEDWTIRHGWNRLATHYFVVARKG